MKLFDSDNFIFWFDLKKTLSYRQGLFFCEQVTRTLTSAINRFEMPDPKREEPKPLQTSVGWVGRVGLVGWVLESARA